MPKPIKLEIRESNEQIITPGGLAMAGHLISRTSLYEKADAIKTREKANPQIKNSDAIGSYIGILSQGKNDYEAANEFKEEPEYYSGILGIRRIPSAETLRQRLDAISPQLRNALVKSNIELLKEASPQIGKTSTGHIPIDIDVTPLDNSGSKKEGVSQTYMKFKGYAPILAYIGTEGYIINTELREGSRHSQNGTAQFLAETIKASRKIADGPLLARMDAGNDSEENLIVFSEEETKADYIIKRNLRNEDRGDWLAFAKQDKKGAETEPRDGKTVYVGSNCHDFEDGRLGPVRIVYEITERLSKADGQVYMEPDIEISTWWTSLPEEGEGSVANEAVIQLYHEHGTCEQFHSELKTDMDLERLPSGNFKTNAAIWLMGMLAYNILRIIGQASLTKDDSPLKCPVRRRRIKTVIQNLITFAVRVVCHARKTYLNMGKSNAWRHTFKRVYYALVLEGT